MTQLDVYVFGNKYQIEPLTKTQTVMKKILLWITGILLTLILGLFIFVQASWNKTYNVPYPEVNISTDSSILARGKYLVYGPSHCATCHVPMDKIADIDKGLEVPLIGGWELSFPLGILRAPNLTPDKETGIGNLTDAELARSLRHLVSADGSMVFPIMETQNLSEGDMNAIISYLRSTEPVRNKVQPTEMALMGKALMAFGMLKPEGPKGTPPKSVPVENSIAYGKYIANDVAVCQGCHTEMDMTGVPIGEYYAGGRKFSPDESDFFKGYGFVSPNLTKDPNTGLLAHWDEEIFINRFRGGRVHQYSPMAWGSYSRMNKVEIRAIYKYLKSLAPVENQIAKTVYAPGEEFPK